MDNKIKFDIFVGHIKWQISSRLLDAIEKLQRKIWDYSESYVDHECAWSSLRGYDPVPVEPVEWPPVPVGGPTVDTDFDPWDCEEILGESWNPGPTAVTDEDCPVFDAETGEILI